MPGKIGLLVAVLLFVSATQAQSRHAAGGFGGVDLAITGNAERGQVAPADCCFWMSGPAIDIGVTLRHGLGAAGEVMSDRASDIAPGVDLAKIDYFAGPRYTWQPHRSAHTRHPVDVFGQALFGGVHAYRTVIPIPGTLQTSANAFAMEAGGGVDLRIVPHFGFRLLDADYVYSQIPNNASGKQSDFRIGAGLLFHFR